MWRSAPALLLHDEAVVDVGQGVHEGGVPGRDEHAQLPADNGQGVELDVGRLRIAQDHVASGVAQGVD